ncbi:hypothetical protein CXG81DRAFT_4251, partial [Caulochytrium protostelioides]
MEELERAVSVALSPQADPQFKQQATQYCEQVRTSPDGWRTCLQLFTRMQPQPAETQVRFICLQILQDVVRNQSDRQTPEERAFLRQTLWQWLTTCLRPSEPAFLKNRLANLLLVMAVHHPQEWPGFFDDMMRLVSDPPQPTPGGSNNMYVDIFLRVALDVEEEVVSSLVVRTPEQLARNMAFKDAMREKAIGPWIQILYQTLAGSAHQPEIPALCLRALATYIPWIDIQLIDQPHLLRLLFELCQLEAYRNDALQCLIEIVHKGMKPAAKVALILRLKFIPFATQLVAQEPDDEILTYVERIAKFVNAQGEELLKAWNDAAQAIALHETDMQAVLFVSYQAITELLPIGIELLTHSFDETSAAVLPFLNAYTTLMKRLARIAGTHPTSNAQLRGSNAPAWRALLGALLTKMRYDPAQAYGVGGGASEEQAEFLELRKELRIAFDAMGVIDEPLFMDVVLGAIHRTLDRALATAPTALHWTDAEHALYLLYTVPETFRIPLNFSPSHATAAAAASARFSEPFAPLWTKLLSSHLITHPHPAVALMYFENVTRYAAFFEVHHDQPLLQVLHEFVGATGLHHALPAVRCRINYLFLRCVRMWRNRLVPIAPDLLVAIHDLLTIDPPTASATAAAAAASSSSAAAATPVPTGAASSGLNTATGNTSSPSSTLFDSQLYLFESVGVLIALDNVPISKQVELLRAALTPSMTAIAAHVESGAFRREPAAAPADPNDQVLQCPQTLHLHRLLMSMGSVFQGFPSWDVMERVVTRSDSADQLAALCQQILDQMLIGLNQASDRGLIREAIRSTFKRMTASLGPAVLYHIEPFLSAGLIAADSVPDMLDLLPFIGMIVFRFKASLTDTLAKLYLPLLHRLHFLLRRPPAGTDELVEQTELKRAYLTFFGNIFMADMENVLVMGENGGELMAVIEILEAIALDPADGTIQKMAFNILNRMILAWLDQTDGTPLPGFDAVVKNQIIPVLFRALLNPRLRLGDGVTLVVLSEMSAIHRHLLMCLGWAYLSYLQDTMFPAL